jgi:LacI family transcriptional regulator
LDSTDDIRRERLNLDVAVQQRVQGILISPVEEDNLLLDSYVREGVPLVFLDRIRSRRDRCSVSVDHLKGGRLAVEYLVRLGHRRIAVVGGSVSFRQVAERLRGANNVAGEVGASIVHMATPGMAVSDGARAGRELVATPRSLRPTAVLCVTDLVAIGFQQECIRHGVRIGYDNLDLSEAAAVPLSTVAQPRREMGAMAARLLLDELDSGDNHVHQQIVLEPQLVERASTKAVDDIV